MSDAINPQIKVICENCNEVMEVYQSLKSLYYRCQNFPRCSLTANPLKVSLAIDEKIVTEIIKMDKIKIYRYDSTDNVVYVKEAKKDKKILSKLDKGIWR